MGFLKRLSFPMNDVSSDPEVLKPEASDGMTSPFSAFVKPNGWVNEWVKRGFTSGYGRYIIGFID